MLPDRLYSGVNMYDLLIILNLLVYIFSQIHFTIRCRDAVKQGSMLKMIHFGIKPNIWSVALTIVIQTRSYIMLRHFVFLLLDYCHLPGDSPMIHVMKKVRGISILDFSMVAPA